MNRQVLLIEPNYKNKYPPMGLMKIATYYRRCKDDVRFFKGDLRLFAARLLCEEYFAEMKDIKLGRHYAAILRYIKNGRNADLTQVHDFCGTEHAERLRPYHLRFRRGDFPQFDVVAVTTLFTFYVHQSVDTINFAKQFCKVGGKMMVGGIAATILPDYILEKTGVVPHVGLLNKPGDLDEGNTDIIDELPLDYSILDEIEYVYPAHDAYFGYMTRGCPRNCAFCAVKTLEPEYKNYIGIKHQIEYVNERFGEQRHLLLMDNNVFASKCFHKIIEEIKACGFARGAAYTPPNAYDRAIKNIKDGYNPRAYIRRMVKIYDKIATKLPEQEAGDFYLEREERGLLYEITATVDEVLKFDHVARSLYDRFFKAGKRVRYIDYNQGLDARLITEKKMAKLAEVNIRPLRIAFDHYAQKDIYISAVRLAAKYGICDLSNYLLYNFEDEPLELYHRMRINVDLCEELGVRIYSFPMKYHPISDPLFFGNRDYIGKHWNRKFIRAIQAVLNATKGKIGRGVSFFEEAFGRDAGEFMKILWMPETFIIYRRIYDAELRSRMAGRYATTTEFDCDLTNEWWRKFQALSKEQTAQAKKIIARNRFKDGEYQCDDEAVLDVLSYYKIMRKSCETQRDD